MRISVITDIISQDLEYALDFLSDLEISYVDLRTMWGKNIVNLTQEELLKAADIIKQRDMKVSCLTTPIFKCFLKKIDNAVTGDSYFVKEETYEEHIKFLNFSFKLAKMFETKIIRIFSFWKIKYTDKIWDGIFDKLSFAVNLASKNKFTLALENENTCNICDTKLVLKFFRSIKNKNVKLLWDPCNSLMEGNDPFVEYQKIKDLICHVHAKNVVLSGKNKYNYVKVSDGIINFKNLIQNMAKDNYKEAISLEFHVKDNPEKDEQIIKDSIIFLKNAISD